MCFALASRLGLCTCVCVTVLAHWDFCKCRQDSLTMSVELVWPDLLPPSSVRQDIPECIISHAGITVACLLFPTKAVHDGIRSDPQYTDINMVRCRPQTKMTHGCVVCFIFLLSTLGLFCVFRLYILWGRDCTVPSRMGASGNTKILTIKSALPEELFFRALRNLLC